MDIDELIKLGTQTIMGALWLLTGLLLLICVAILLGASAIQLSEEISQGLALRNTESQPLEPHQLSKLDQSLIALDRFELPSIAPQPIAYNWAVQSDSIANGLDILTEDDVLALDGLSTTESDNYGPPVAQVSELIYMQSELFHDRNVAITIASQLVSLGLSATVVQDTQGWFIKAGPVNSLDPHSELMDWLINKNFR